MLDSQEPTRLLFKAFCDCCQAPSQAGLRDKLLLSRDCQNPDTVRSKSCEFPASTPTPENLSRLEVLSVQVGVTGVPSKHRDGLRETQWAGVHPKSHLTS